MNRAHYRLEPDPRYRGLYLSESFQKPRLNATGRLLLVLAWGICSLIGAATVLVAVVAGWLVVRAADAVMRGMGW